ncbi:hypothetical protein KCU77_g5993, partial [Aureobasidium melanogenum]
MATRPFSCLRCPKGANSRSNMESHITNMHTAVKPFACTEHGCAVTCARADYLRDHVRDAHGRLLRPHERTGDAAIIRSIKDEARRTGQVAVAAAPPAPPAPPASPGAILADPPAAPPANINWALVP